MTLKFKTHKQYYFHLLLIIIWFENNLKEKYHESEARVNSVKRR